MSNVINTFQSGLPMVEVLLYVHRNRRFIRDGSPGRPPRLSHSCVEHLVEVLLYVHRNRRFIRDGSPGRSPRLSHSSSALLMPDDDDDDDDDDELMLNVLRCQLTY